MLSIPSDRDAAAAAAAVATAAVTAANCSHSYLPPPAAGLSKYLIK